MNGMDYEQDLVNKLPTKNLIDPNGFDVSMSAVLIGLGAEKYTNIFRDHNIGQCTLIELTDEDLVKLGVDDPKIRVKLIEEVKNLPIYEETDHTEISPNLDVMDIVDILEESSQHMYRINISMMTNTLVLKKKKVPDCLIYKDKYASHIAINTLSHMTNVLNSMETSLHSQIQILSKDSRNRRTKKLLVGTLGSAVVAVIAIFFVRSLKHL
uniref:SAM domain-containing protein n=1 Tax=Pararge aegeria TaxID=116150 RepID=S4P766_9NEOP